MINLSIWESNIPSVTFLNGVLLFVGGISVIRVHNFWVRNWTVLITLNWLVNHKGTSNNPLIRIK